MDPKQGFCWGAGVVILLSIQPVEMTWDRLQMDCTKCSDWWYGSGMMCACDCEVLNRLPIQFGTGVVRDVSLAI